MHSLTYVLQKLAAEPWPREDGEQRVRQLLGEIANAVEYEYVPADTQTECGGAIAKISERKRLFPNRRQGDV